MHVAQPSDLVHFRKRQTCREPSIDLVSFEKEEMQNMMCNARVAVLRREMVSLHSFFWRNESSPPLV